MRVLALEPYYGGSHQAFLNGWSSRSRHEWTILQLPPHKWKWRMRHAAITFAQQVEQRLAAGESWDAIFCSDMLNLAEFLGLAPAPLRGLPSIAYYHENQLTYPVRHEDERDYHFVLTNITTALAARRVWFNSAFHRDEFLGALPRFLSRMPDHQPLGVIEQILAKSEVHYPGVDEFPARGPRPPGPLRILWAARWEHDKNPDTFFEALKLLKSSGVEFRLSVIGEQFREHPPVFDWARDYFRSHIDCWGHQPTRGDYVSALLEADVIVSTANHEFFGLSVVEAITVGAYPLLPRRLAYPEILSSLADAEPYFYDGSAEALCDRLASLASRPYGNNLWPDSPQQMSQAVARFKWAQRSSILDSALAACCILRVANPGPAVYKTL